MEGPWRVSGRLHGDLPYRSARAPDADGRPAASYLGTHVWLPADKQRRCGISQAQGRRTRGRRDTGYDDRTDGYTAAGIFARHGVELFAFDGRAWISGRQNFRNAV